MNTSIKERIPDLRQVMQRQELDGFIVPKADEYQGEFLASYAERLPYMTDFTGSGGAAVILQDKAVVLTDGRYLIQVKQQVDPDIFATGDITKENIGKWLARNISGEAVIGYDPYLHTTKQIELIESALEGTKITLRAIHDNPVDRIWLDRPERPNTQAFLFPDEIAGKTAAEKRRMIARELMTQGADAALLTMPDSIAWLLNIRGSDVKYIPLILSYAVIYADERVDWFVDEDIVSGDVQMHLGEGVNIVTPQAITARLKKIAQAGKTILIDKRYSPIIFDQLIEKNGGKILYANDPCVLPKAQKTPQEQEAVRRAHRIDGVAMVRFLKWLEESLQSGGVTEVSAADKLEAFRASDPSFRGPSFPTIAGYGSHGAIVHYRASEKTDKVLEPSSLFLLDSGGQYMAGTTDITRTVAIGKPSEDMRRHFTIVLKGHIGLAMARFKQGTLGKEIDAIARAPLKAEGIDFAHGTGHGVGCYLAVHEEAASISPRGETALKEGMLISNEPGYYQEGDYGIRIENLVLVHDDEEGDELYFETVTLCPIDSTLIISDMLSAPEREWLNNYHESVYTTLAPRLDDETAAWLRAKTTAI